MFTHIKEVINSFKTTNVTVVNTEGSLNPREVLIRDSVKEMLALYDEEASMSIPDIVIETRDGLVTILNLFNEGCQDCGH